jgi:adenylate cyclase
VPEPPRPLALPVPGLVGVDGSDGGEADEPTAVPARTAAAGVAGRKPARVPWFRARLSGLLPVVASAVLILAVLLWQWGPVASREGILAPTIAVLPFVDTSPEHDGEYLGDGIADELISTLAQVEGLRVAARTSAFAFKGSSATVRTIGEELNVATILEGSVRRSGDRLRIRAQLVSVRDGYSLWAQTYERDLGAMFAIEAEIARAVIERLNGRAGLTGGVATGKSHTANVEAYHLYLHGRYFWHRRDDPQRRHENLERSIAYFHEALALDPRYARAYAGLADSYASMVGRLPRAEVYARARAAAERALELDERLAEAHVALARILVFEEWNWAAAGQSYRRALELSPNDATARQWYAMYLLHLGLIEGAIREIRFAQQLDPLSIAVNNDAGRILYNARMFDEATEQFRKTLELDPASADAHLHLGLLSVENQSLEGALMHFRQWAQLSGDQPTTLVTYAYAATGRRMEARQMLTRLLETAGSARVPPAGVALVYAHLGEADSAFEWLDRAFEERSSFLLFLKVTPRLDPLRSDPRFALLLRRMALE